MTGNPKERIPLTSGYCQSKGVGQPFLLGTREMLLPEGFPPHSQDETYPLLLHLNFLWT